MRRLIIFNHNFYRAFMEGCSYKKKNKGKEKRGSSDGSNFDYKSYKREKKKLDKKD